MRVFQRQYVLGCVLIFFVSCQTKVASIPPAASPEMLSLPALFSRLEARRLGIRDVKAFVRTKIYGDRCRIPFSINARFDHMDEEIISALARSGLSLVHCGIESGNDYMRNTVMLREQTLDSIYKAAKLLKKYGVKLLTENVLGNPGETFEMAMKTLKLNMKLKPNIANASIFAPYPGLKMTQYAIDKGYFDGNFDRLEATYFDKSVLKFKKKEDERKIQNLKTWEEYQNKWENVKQILKNKILLMVLSVTDNRATATW